MTIAARFWRAYHHARNTTGGVLHLLLHQFIWDDKKRTGR
jgi:hypothetical protein